MAYGASADFLDEYLKMSERTIRECLNRSSKCVVELFSKIYLRKPSVSDVQKRFTAHEERHDFPGMLGSIDWTQWDWGNCPQAWRGMYTRGHHGTPSLILEAISFQYLWIWLAFLGLLTTTTISMYSINPQYLVTC